MIVATVVLLVFAKALNRLNDVLKEQRRERIAYLAEESAKEQESILKEAKKRVKAEKKAEDPLDRYKASVTWFCRYMAECQKMAEMMKRGEAVDPKRLKFSLSMVRQYKAFVLRDKQECNLDVDMSAFSTEQKFRGFELRGGSLIKDRDADDGVVQEIARKWVKGFPAKYSAWYFEIGTLLLCLDQPLMDEYYPQEWQKRWRSKMAA